VKRALKEAEACRERKRSKEALVQSEIKYRTLVEHLPAITYIATLDESSTTLYVSPQIEEILGISPVEYKADPDFWEKHLHPDDRERVMDEVHRCHESGQPFISEYRMFSKDGRLVWLSDDAVTVRDDRGNPFHLQGVMYDITKRKQAENALQESERIWRDSFNSLEDVMLIIDRDYNIENINCSGLSLLGKSKKEVVGKKCYQIVHGVDSPGEYCPFRKVLKTKKVSSTDLYEDRFGKHFSIKSSPTFNEKGEIIKFVDLIRDITELKLAQEEREKMRTQLQQAQKMEAIGALAGGIAHDFNNILYPIIGYAELAMDHVSEGGVVQKNLHEILTAANRAKDLVQQILTFSRQGEHERKFIKTQPIIKEVLRLLRSSIPTSIKISQSIDKECGDILADPTQIYQVLTNLCTNAYHAMREKGGVLEVSLLEEEISPDDSKSNLDLFPGKYLKLTVSDTGHGMDQAVIKRIFDPYFTTKPFGEGTGLGLAITHGIVKSCGGGIQVYSKPGEGTTFHVYIPLIEESSYAQQSISTEPIRKGNKSILLVDDEDQIVRMVQETLRGLGYHVTPHTSSVEALEAFRAQPDKFDLVITDMTMPNMTGAELAPKLLDIRPDIPIILCTGFSEEINKEKAKAMGIREYILKPVVRDVIARTIRKVLDE
jgi:PAS domain S-box-containing protein